MTAEISSYYPNPEIPEQFYGDVNGNNLVAVPNDVLEGYYSPSMLSNAAKLHDAGRGKLRRVKEDFTFDSHSGNFPRQHDTAILDTKKDSYELRLTEPIEPDDDYEYDGFDTIAVFHGYSERPNRSTGLRFHDEIAADYPGKKVVSMTSAHARCDRLADDRLETLEDLVGTNGVLGIGESMGTTILQRMAARNSKLGVLPMKKLVYHDPAIVEPHRVAKDMGVRFSPHVLLDIFKQTMCHPDEAVKSLKGIPLPRPSEFYPNVKNVMELFDGTPFHETAEVVQGHDMRVIGGSKDPLLQLPMWKKLQQMYPDNLQIHEIPGGGHGANVNAPEAARVIRAAISGE